MSSAAKPVRILFVHGLESGPQGRKVSMLRDAGFEVECPRMPCGARDVLHDTVVFYPLLACTMLIGLVSQYAGLLGVLLSLLAFGIALVVSSGPVTALIARRTLARCVNIQLACIARAAADERSADIVIGSSFGGAVLVELVARSAWGGNCAQPLPALLLLAPAHARVAHWAGARKVPALPRPLRHACTIAHGAYDMTVPISDSYALASSGGGGLSGGGGISAVSMVRLDDDGHELRSVDSALLVRWVEELLCRRRAVHECALAATDEDERISSR
jgi:hypothetical protein